MLCYNGSYFIPLYYKYKQSEISGKHNRFLLKITHNIYEVVSNILTGAPLSCLDPKIAVKNMWNLIKNGKILHIMSLGQKWVQLKT